MKAAPIPIMFSQHNEMRLTSGERKPMNSSAVELKEKHFRQVCSLVYRYSGIHLKKGKEALVKTRLMKRLRKLNIDSFDDYLRYLESEEGHLEMGMMIDVMTTNKTSFFREPAHFDFLSDSILPNLDKKKFRIWSAACSSGQEPYSIGMSLRENISGIEQMDVRILATDISKRILQEANTGIYGEDKIDGLSTAMLNKYFSRIRSGEASAYRIKDEIRQMVSVAFLNLLGKWPMKGPFDVIFCRNVMIYFDHQTQQTLINRFWDILEHGGYLFVGHSEGLSAVKHKFDFVQAAVYRK